MTSVGEISLGNVRFERVNNRRVIKFVLKLNTVVVKCCIHLGFLKCMGFSFICLVLF